MQLALEVINFGHKNFLKSDLDRKVYVHHLAFIIIGQNIIPEKVENLIFSLTQYTKQLRVVCHSESTVSSEIELPDENDTLTLDDYEEHYFDEGKPSWALNSPSYTVEGQPLVLTIFYTYMTQCGKKNGST